jgi:surface antigen
MSGNKKAMKLAAPVILGACIFTLLLVTIFSAVAYVAEPVVAVVDAISKFFSSLNITSTDTGVALEDALKEWQSTDGLELETHYSPGCSSFYLAEAVSFYYYNQTGRSIVQDGNWTNYLNCFSATDTVTIYDLMRVQYGYDPDGSIKEKIGELGNSLLAAGISRNNSTDLKAFGFEGTTGCTATENTMIMTTDPMNDFIWQQAYVIGGGNPFYYAAKAGLWDPRQCTTFAWYRFYQYYGYDSGARGSGYIDAEQVVAAHPDKFILSSDPAPGSIVSFPRTYGPDGHVGFIEKVEGSIVWLSDGNWGKGNIRLNKKTSVQELDAYYCMNGDRIKYAVPIKQ